LFQKTEIPVVKVKKSWKPAFEVKRECGLKRLSAHFEIWVREILKRLYLAYFKARRKGASGEVFNHNVF